MVVSSKTDLRFPESGQQGHGARIIHFRRMYLVYLLDEVSNQYHKEISSDVINKYQFKKVDDIVNFILEG